MKPPIGGFIVSAAGQPRHGTAAGIDARIGGPTPTVALPAAALRNG